MNLAGTLLLAIAAIASLAGVVLSIAGGVRGRLGRARAGTYAAYVTLGATVAATLVLLAALLARDFGNLYVYEHSSRALSVVYTISALWAGNAGSLLVWLLLLTVFAAVAGRSAWRRDPPSAGYVVATLSAMSLFFSLLLLFGPRSDPFVSNPLVPSPADGLGLNPQLLNVGMIIHPVTLYVGYVAMAVPFALMAGGLGKGSPLSVWLPSVRVWALVGWLFLTIGNVVGAWWAYVTLGWGGYWAWDPVENASLIPWLTATALLHALAVVRTSGRQRIWTMALITVTFLLTILGTFLTRSGVAASVHAFEEAGMIPWFVTFLLVMLALAVGFIVWRLPMLRGDGSTESWLSQSANFLYTNVLLSIMTFVILWGVIFPPIAEALGGGEVVLGTEFFNVVTTPLGLALLLLLAFCMLFRASKGSLRRLGVDLAITGGFGLLVLVLLLAMGVDEVYPAGAFALLAMVVAALVLSSIRRGMGWKKRRGYGALLVHLGLAILVIGVAGSWAYKQGVENELAVGDSLSVGQAVITYRGLESEERPDKTLTRGLLGLSIGGEPSGSLRPTLEYYPAGDQTWTRVARSTSIAGDVYVTLLAADASDQTVSVRLEVHPLIEWLWVGGAVMALGGLLALVLGRVRRPRPGAGLAAVADAAADVAGSAAAGAGAGAAEPSGSGPPAGESPAAGG